MSVIDWDAKPAPWCWVGKQAAVAFKRIANPDFDPPAVKIRRLRIEQGINAVGLSSRVGLPRDAIRHIEEGFYTPNKNRQRAIERALGVEVGTIWPEGE